jgi:preprotein translocase subunit SecG
MRAWVQPFGGGMTENLFGAQTTNVLQSFTRNLGIFFFALTALISWLYVKQGTIKSDIQKQLAAAPAVPCGNASSSSYSGAGDH